MSGDPDAFEPGNLVPCIMLGNIRSSIYYYENKGAV
jgi:hypothetical protein